MIRGCWCQRPDGFSVLGYVLGLCYHTSVLQPREPQTAGRSRWGLVMGCPKLRAGAGPSEHHCPARATEGRAAALRQGFPKQRHLCCCRSAAAHPGACVFLHWFCLQSAAAAVRQRILMLLPVLSLQGICHRGAFPRGRLTTHPWELFL